IEEISTILANSHCDNAHLCNICNVRNVCKKLGSLDEKEMQEFLLSDYKEPIKLTQFEYDLLINCKETTGYNENDIIENYWIIRGMKQKGYFKNIELSMNFKEVLENCEVE